jgi:hypothetical protein
MEPNKTENEFKKKLEQRTIQPSSMAWDRLDAMLSVAEKKKQKPKRTWMYIAASFLGFILIATVFINQNNTEGDVKNNESPVVAAPNAAPAITDDNIVDPQVIKQEPVVQERQNAVAGVTKQVRKAKEAMPVQKQELIKSNEPFMQKSVQEAVVNTVEINIKKPAISAEEEAEQLLSASLNNKVKKKSVVKVSSNSLLSNVEGELNESFRDKVLQSVSKNYNTVKTSLANRNRE